ncbi:MFS family permease [Kineosphaera limosa]|uniref:ATP synthase protein I n=1 Tax=Kineosphaera limosa NBRC 100340 TaxID=1184609 RepID=K6X091_9MICO|nr:AtpZ/AtpI family protein [Kineosphaera limosa]NYD99601.1 MFS family permease [Kineosphaera limosa]GAB97767.1 hypothetical protein KILIM_081_00090 [Kineosphaera limosa NBRC 100340]
MTDRKPAAPGPDSANGATAAQPPAKHAEAVGADRLGATVTAYLVTGPVLYALLGWLADRWLGTSFLLPAGLLGGMALSLYLVWLRYGKP